MFFENDIKKCITILKNGGIILYPTDTIWGIGCDATNENAVAKIYALKKRPDEKSMIVLLDDEKKLSTYVTKPQPDIFKYLQNTKKPTTVIYEGAINLAKNLINRDGSIAIRIVKDNFCKKLIEVLGKPIVSTSANISGSTSPQNFNAITAEIKMAVDYIVQHRQQDKATAQPSAIIKRNADGTIHIIRS
jgi:L-threonylcarbamoyladenylate synthase